ncbi:hypothetical protein [Haloechinothrix salitolerans]|uniref:Mce-associated membrane protein n=1 Tax=Haloechinothrix salitolerans TaxID=926830 RepID=A0ABW2BWC9_9PSEU
MSVEHGGASGGHDAVSPAQDAVSRTRTRRVVIAGLSIVLVLATVSAVVSGIRAHQLRDTESAANTALVDTEATNAVIEQVSASLKAVFSYDYTRLERTEHAVEVALIGEAAAEYRREFDAAAKQAKRRELVKAATVRAIGVRELTDGRASVLVFLDQQVRRQGAAPTSSTATLDVTALRDNDGTWRISDIEGL